MRKILLAGIAFSAVCLSGLPVRAEVYYPWCAWYDWSTYNCGFTSYRQCLATISGQGGECRPNQNPPPSPAPRRGKRKSEAPAAPGPLGAAAPRAGEPARMVRLPNGRWVSSYSCYTDEGYGRYRECNVGDHD
ncbi:MAG TPA: DUF3551 domain-containing protein [Pseudorhodoplanes sp.]|jgi:hypothetical protein|nr:DUF3551 domain-containing protein [Pseudorhodoplanes sp.]